MKVKLFFALYDFWIGAFYDRSASALYICPLPCVVIKIWREKRYISFRGTAMDGSPHETARPPWQPDKAASDS